jgi:hypothetical protein
MFVNRIKICPDLHTLQLGFSRLRQCLFLKLLRQITRKMGGFLIKHVKTFASDLYLIYKLSPSARVCM